MLVVLHVIVRYLHERRRYRSPIGAALNKETAEHWLFFETERQLTAKANPKRGFSVNPSKISNPAAAAMDRGLRLNEDS
jgi:hypothetical protein